VILRIQGRVSGAIEPAAASGSTPARITRAAWRNSISTACASDKMIARIPKIRITAGAAPPPRTSTLVSRWVNWPPVETCKTHVDQASPAWSRSAGTMVPSVVTAARVSRPPVTSSSGLARRAITSRTPAAIIAATATVAVIGSSQDWIRVIAGSAARSGEGIRSHQVAVFVTVHRTPSVIAPARPDRTSDAAVDAAEVTAWDTSAQAGSTRVSQCMAVTSRRRTGCSRPGM
jgi:hypothetical protein